MQILISGAFGYIGSQILDSLAAHPDYRAATVVAVDNWSYGRGMAPLQAYFKEKLPRLRSVCLDISEPSEELRRLVLDSDYIINSASLTQVPTTHLHEKYIIDGVQNLADMLLSGPAKVRKIIDISSTSIYGPVRTRMPEVKAPYPETVWPEPSIALHNYAASKLQAEKIWQSDRCRGLPWTMFRLSTVFGYAVGMRYNQFINQFLVDTAAGRATVFPGSPDNIRPFVHVKDVAAIMLHLFENDRHCDGELINIGATRLNPRLGDLYARLSKVLKEDFGLNPQYQFASELGQPTIEESYQVDFSKFERLVNCPLRWDFEGGARELVAKVLDLPEP